MARPRKTTMDEQALTIAEGSGRVDTKSMRDEENKPVKGRFRFYDPPGASVEFYFRKYKGDPIEKYTFQDDEVYTIPLAVARHINENAFEEQHHYLLDEKGNPVKDAKRKRRAEFIPLDFS